MAEKANLMVEAAKKSDEITRLEAKIEECNSGLASLSQRYDAMKREAREKALASFTSRQKELLARVDGIVEKKRQEAEALIDTFPGMETKEFAGRFEIKELQDHLMEVYPAAMIEDYICMNPTILEEDEEAFRVYSSVEKSVMSLSRGGSLVTKLFNGITSTLTTMTEDPNMGLKIIPVVLLFYGAAVFFLPFVFLTVFTAIGCASAAQGFFVKGLLRKLYSVKLYLNTTYDEDIFSKDRTDVLGEVNDYLEEARQKYAEYINSREFTYDPAIENKLEHDKAMEQKKLEQTRELATSNKEKLQEELQNLLSRIEELEEAERKKAENARSEYFENITWKREWMDQLFVDITPENRILKMPYTRGNSLYYAEDVQDLKHFSRLVCYQSMLHMHPEYASQVVLDYKYMGGELTQFFTLKGKCIRLCYTEDDIRKQIELMDNEIKARTKSIMASSSNLDEFNELMASYGATGEYYVVVHIFGAEQLSGTMLNWFRNGYRVGYLFKFYWTTEELQVVKDSIPFADIRDYFEIKATPIARTAASVKRIAGVDS